MLAVERLRNVITEKLSAAAEEILGVFVQTVSVYEDEINRQRVLLDAVLKPEVRLHRTELPQQHVSNEGEEVLTDQQLCNPGTDQKPPQIKEEQEELCTSQEGEQLVQKQEDDFLNSSPACERLDQSEDWTLVLNCDQNESAAEKDPPENISTQSVRFESDRESSRVSEPNSDHELPFQRSNHRKAKKHRGDLTSATNIKPRIKKGQNDQDHKTYSGVNIRSSANSQPKLNEKTFKCKSCSKRFYMYTQLKVHMRTHAAEKPFRCTLCEKGFHVKRYLKQHMITHSAEKPYTCSTCRKGFRRLEHLQIHIRSHTGERPYSCVYCHRAFSVNSTLIKHIRLHTD